jgi:hypothetical protein
MKTENPANPLMICFFLFFTYVASAQDKRAQFPGLLSNSYFGVNIGYINYPFSNKHIKPGYSAQSVRVPNVGVRIILFGHEFNRHLSAQITYMRPVDWVLYQNVNSSNTHHSVWMNVGGLTVKSQFPLVKNKLSVYNEAGLGLITRNGFEINNVPVVEDVSYAGFLFGAGLQYKINKKWDLQLSAAWSPEHAKASQPSTVFFSGGFNHNLRELSAEKVARNSNPKYIFPKNLLQAGYSTNALGYEVNHFLADGTIPVFWGGTVAVQNGLAFHYQRNIFHVRKVFSFDWGVSMGFWKTQISKERFFTVSAFPVFRFTLVHTKPADFYFYYSVAGPTYISKAVLDSTITGRQFTFQDLMGIGMFSGKKRKFNSEIRIGHYSNGNIFPDNKGIKIPLTFNAGYTF